MPDSADDLELLAPDASISRGSIWSWVEDKYYSFRVGAAGVADLVTGDTHLTEQVLSEKPVAGLTEEHTRDAAHKFVENGGLSQAWDKTETQLTPTIPWYAWAGIIAGGTLTAVVAVRSVLR